MSIEYLSPEEYACRFNRKVRTVVRWCQQGLIPTLPRPYGTRQWRIIVGPVQRGEVVVKNNVRPFRQPTPNGKDAVK